MKPLPIKSLPIFDCRLPIGMIMTDVSPMERDALRNVTETNQSAIGNGFNRQSKIGNDPIKND